ncbi:hypothetical protein NKY39_16000 [Sinorhizobium meliloti]|uniref:hypothetical protein n=1 Tax=Rhizobium meliloti TaxID=382 RepID=UPI003D65F819
MSNVTYLPTPKRPWRNFLLRDRETGRPNATLENLQLALTHDKRLRRCVIAGDKAGCRRRLVNFGFHWAYLDWLIDQAARELRSQRERRAPQRPGVRQ